MTEADRLMHPLDGGGWKRMEDGDSRLMGALRPEPSRAHRMYHLFVYKNQVMFDIDSQIGMIMGSRRGENGTENTANSAMTDKYKGMFDRWIEKYLEKVKERLILCVMDSRNESRGDDLKDWAEKEILLEMPEWWDDTAWKPLVDCVHNYIVSGVISEYLKITLTSKDPVTVDKMAETEDCWNKMRVLQTMHKGTMKKPLKPLGF